MTATTPAGRTKNLTREEAAERSALLSVTGYDVTLDLTDGAGGPGAGTFRSRTRIIFDCARPGAAVRVELAAVAVHAATLNDRPVDTAGWSADQGLPLTGLAAVNVLVVDAEFGYSTSGQGMHRAVDPADDEVYLYTHFEPTAAQRVFACFDQPDLKATFTWHATVPDGWRVVSNMPADRVEPADATPGGAEPHGAEPAGRPAGRGKTVHFPPTPRMSTYLAALCAGPFHEVRDSHDGVDLGLFCRRSMAGFLDADEIFTVTRQGFDFFHDRFGVRYPLAKYDQIFVPEYNTGAMENFGAVTFSEQRYLFRSVPTELDHEHRASTILHELAHVWLGNLVTMYWWDDLWLKESLATWASYWASAEGATRFTDAWAMFLLTRKSRGYDADQLSSTHPVYTSVPDVDTALANFDGITYFKGASFVKQLAAYVGVDTFVAGLRGYFAAHLWGNASFADLVRALEEASGRPLRDNIRRWLETVEVNTFRLDLAVDGDGRYQSAVVDQTAPAAAPTLRAHRLAVGRYVRQDDRLVRQDQYELDVTGARTELPELLGTPVADLLLPNDDDLSYAKIRFDAWSMATLRDGLWRLDSSTARGLCHLALDDMVRCAELAAREHIPAVLDNLAQETHVVLVSAALDRLEQVLTRSADPGWADTGWRLLASQAKRSLATAPPGSGLQLTWARAYASAARDGADVRIPHRWWSTGEGPPGLVVDTGLRWHLLRCLVATGAAGPAEIETMLAGDQTAAGLLEAATASALVPTAEAKEDAWRLLTGADDLPNWRARGLAAGFQHPAQVALTARYVERFFADVELIWYRRRAEVCQTVIPLLYPTHQVSTEVVAATDEWLADPGRAEPLRRLVLAGRDRVVAALAARALDAGTNLSVSDPGRAGPVPTR